MNLVEWIQSNLVVDNPLLTAVCITILFILIYDFYHALFSAILTWFKR